MREGAEGVFAVLHSRAKEFHKTQLCARVCVFMSGGYIGELGPWSLRPLVEGILHHTVPWIGLDWIG